MPLDPLYFSPHEHTSQGDDGTTDLIGTVHTPDEVYLMKRFMAGQDRSQHTLDPKPKFTTDRYQRGLTPIRIRTRDTWLSNRNSLKRYRLWRIVNE